MSYRNDRFNQGMRSLETMLSGHANVSKTKSLCDEPALERMLDALDYDEAAETDREKRLHADRYSTLFGAEMRLVWADLQHLIPTLLLIIENRRNRDASIDSMAATSKTRNAARKKYYAHKDALLDFFQK